jgi:hypothetical protein
MSKRLALCIGIDKLSSLGNMDLRFARKDAQGIHSILADPDQGGFASILLLDEDATRAKILASISSLLQDPTLCQDDMILIYFSGHGGLDNADNLFLVAHDTALVGTEDSIGIDLSTTVHIKELEIRLDNTRAGTVIILLDTCHSGASGKLLSRIRHRDRENMVIIGSALQAQAAKEDPAFEHGVFTECLLRGLHEPPSRGEWITLQEVLSFVSSEMEKLGLKQVMEVSSHSINPNIMIAKNPGFGLVSASFTQTVKNSFKLAGYDVSATMPNLPNFFIAHLKIGFRPVRTGVLCLWNDRTNLSNANTDQFNALIRRMRAANELDNGILVTSRELDEMSKKRLLPIAECLTSDELTERFLDFSEYMRKLVKDFAVEDEDHPWQPPLFSYYIDLKAETRGWKGGKHWRGNIESLFCTWLATPSEQRLAILGDYGSGKTTLCKKLAHDMALKCLTTKDSSRHRIPILIYLRDFPHGPADLEAVLINHLARRCKVPNPNWNAFKAMNDAGLLLLIFDGFDEMAIRSHKDVVAANLHEISKLAASPNSKVVLTSRPEYFFTGAEEEEMLEPSDILFYQRRYRRVTLLPFEDEQIGEFLRKRIPLHKDAKHYWGYYMDRIEQIGGLLELSHKPVLLEMIAKTLPVLINMNAPISRSSLYQTYIDEEINRQIIEKRRHFLLNREERFKLMQIMAKEFVAKKYSGLSAKQLMSLLKDYLTDHQCEELEAHLADFLTFSFLAREDNLYRFSHRTLLEFLAARVLAEEMHQGSPDLFQNVKLTHEIIDFLLEMNHNREIFWKWLHIRQGYTAANSFFALHKAGASFLQRNLSNANLSEVEAREINLVDVDLSGAILVDANLQGALLDGADLESATLERANLSGASLIETNLRAANLSNANLAGACLGRADLAHSNLSGANLSDTVLTDVKFDAFTIIREPKINLARNLFVGAIDPTFARYIMEQNPKRWKIRHGWPTSLKFASRPLVEVRCNRCNHLLKYLRWPYETISLEENYSASKITESIDRHLRSKLRSKCPRCSKNIGPGLARVGKEKIVYLV